MAAMPRALQIGSGYAYLHAAQPHPGRNWRIARGSQPTISRAISVISPLIPEAVREFVPTADDLDPNAQYILDGTLLPCWSWAGHEELYSGKHKTTGMNVQLACTIYGKLAWISDLDAGEFSFPQVVFGHHRVPRHRLPLPATH